MQYGLAGAPCAFWTTLRTALLTEGFQQSQQDPCLFYMKHLILVTYVDNVGIGAKVGKDIDWLIKRLRHHGFTLECEGSFVSYLGIKFDTI